MGILNFQRQMVFKKVKAESSSYSFESIVINGLNFSDALEYVGEKSWEMVQQAPSTWNNRLPTFYFKRQTS